MTWVKIDDALADHPKIRETGKRAPFVLALHVRGLCYAGRYLTDGLLKHGVVTGLLEHLGTQDWPMIMVCAGLWEPHPDGYVIHDYLDYNPSREEVLAERESKASERERVRLATAEWRQKGRDSQAIRRDNNSGDTVTEASPSRHGDSHGSGHETDIALRPIALAQPEPAEMAMEVMRISNFGDGDVTSISPTPSPTPEQTTKATAAAVTSLVSHFEDIAHLEAYEGFRRPHPHPAAMDHEILAAVEQNRGHRPATWHEVGEALHRMAAAGVVRFDGKPFRAFVRGVVAGEAPSHAGNGVPRAVPQSYVYDPSQNPTGAVQWRK